MSNLGLQFSFFTNPSQLCYLGRAKLLEFFGRFKVPWSSDGLPSIFEGCQGTPDMALRLRDSVGELPAEMLAAMKEVEQGVSKAPGRHHKGKFAYAMKAWLQAHPAQAVPAPILAEPIARGVPQEQAGLVPTPAECRSEAEPAPTMAEPAPTMAVPAPIMEQPFARAVSVPSVAEVSTTPVVSAPRSVPALVTAAPQAEPGPILAEPQVEQAVPAPNLTEGASAPQQEPTPVTAAQPVPELSEEQKRLEGLARLSVTEYERVRCAEARALGIRVRALDAEVARWREELGFEAEGDKVELQELVPWPEPVPDGVALLEEVVTRFRQHVFLPPGAADALTLWSLHAHLFRAFSITPRLNLLSVKGECGKTTCLDVVSTLVPRMLRTEHLTSPVLFRVVDQRQPTLLLDEVDAYLFKAEELRGLLNAGHKRGACAYRCDGRGRTIRSFNAFAPAVLSGIGSLPDTLRDRSILIPLTKAEKGQVAHKFNVERAGLELGQKLARWAADNFAAVQGCNPTLAPEAINRSADNWGPLQAIAEVVGGGWGERAREAFAKLAAIPTIEKLEEQLLNDVRGVFAATSVERMFSTDLVQLLRALPERGYGAANGEGLTERKLARVLSRLIAVRPHSIRILGEKGKGYERSELE